VLANLAGGEHTHNMMHALGYARQRQQQLWHAQLLPQQVDLSPCKPGRSGCGHHPASASSGVHFVVLPLLYIGAGQGYYFPPSMQMRCLPVNPTIHGCWPLLQVINACYQQLDVGAQQAVSQTYPAQQDLYYARLVLWYAGPAQLQPA
jgi:hypothetical protein